MANPFLALSNVQIHGAVDNTIVLPATLLMKHRLVYVNLSGDLTGLPWNGILYVDDDATTVWTAALRLADADSFHRIEFPADGLTSAVANKTMTIRFYSAFGGRTSYLNIGYRTEVI